jgi:hypothetical protein
MDIILNVHIDTYLNSQDMNDIQFDDVPQRTQKT